MEPTLARPRIRVSGKVRVSGRGLGMIAAKIKEARMREGMKV